MMSDGWDLTQMISDWVSPILSFWRKPEPSFCEQQFGLNSGLTQACESLNQMAIDANTQLEAFSENFGVTQATLVGVGISAVMATSALVWWRCQSQSTVTHSAPVQTPEPQPYVARGGFARALAASSRMNQAKLLQAGFAPK